MSKPAWNTCTGQVPLQNTLISNINFYMQFNTMEGYEEPYQWL